MVSSLCVPLRQGDVTCTNLGWELNPKGKADQAIKWFRYVPLIRKALAPGDGEPCVSSNRNGCGQREERDRYTITIILKVTNMILWQTTGTIQWSQLYVYNPTVIYQYRDVVGQTRTHVDQS